MFPPFLIEDTMSETLLLPPRLAAVADLAGPCTCVADIGTDHAYLPLFMVREGLCSSAFACDVNQGPLNRAVAAIEKYGLSSAVTPLLSDGLKTVPQTFDSLVIAGMGGDLIAGILYGNPPLCAEKITLQPMTKPEVLRRYLFRHGYSIVKERAVTEGEKRYIILSVQWKPTPSFTEADCYLPQNLECTPHGLDYLEKLLSSRQKRLLGLRRADSPDAAAMAFEEELISRLTAQWHTYSRRLHRETD